MSLNSSSIASIWRLAFRLLVVAAFARLWPGEGAVKAAALLCYALATGCLIAAIAYGERWVGPGLNRWHEAAALLLVATALLLWL
jgi:hypothetical protein